VSNYLFFTVGKSPAKIFAELLRYEKLLISSLTEEKIIYLNYPLEWRNLAKVNLKCHGYKITTIVEQIMVRYVSMVFQKSVSSSKFFRTNEDSTLFNIQSEKYL